MDPALQELLSAELDPNEIVEALVRLNDENIIPEKITPIAQFGDILTCRVTRGDILEVYNSKAIRSMKAPRFIAYNSEFEKEYLGLNTLPKKRITHKSTGKNTIIAVLDWGIDFAHPNFRNSDGTTRFLAIWDQSSNSPDNLAPYGYGQIHYKEDIDRALKTSSPYEHLNYHPGKSDSLKIGTHGTVVADIAAGNGTIGNSGIAPEADLIFVHLASRGTGGTGNLGDSVRILEAIDAVRKLAENRPLVINMSIGRHGGPHDGKTLVEEGLDNFLKSRKQTMICQSTGNYYLSQTHHSGIVRPGKIKTFSFHIQKADATLNEMEIWYHEKDLFDIELINNKTGKSFTCPLNSKQDIIINSKRLGRIYHRDKEPNNGKKHINLFLYKNAPTGKWTVKLKGKKISDGRYHAWIERDGSCKNCQSRFDPVYVDSSSTTGTIANGFNTIVCGAYDNTSHQERIAPFSSKGPTLDGRLKPDIIAPGWQIVAARSTPKHSLKPKPSLTKMSGTSMAAPYVTGVTALVLEELPRIVSYWQIRNIIIGSADQLPGIEPSRQGSGKINIKKALATARRFNSNYNQSGPSTFSHHPEAFPRNFKLKNNETMQLNENFSMIETVDDAIKNAKSLKSKASANEINNLYKKVSKLTGLKHPGLPNNPLIGVTKDMITSAYNAHQMHGTVKSSSELLAIWVKEGGASMHTHIKKFGLSGINASSEKNAKSIFRSYLYYQEMGIDKFIDYKTSSSDNIASFENDDASVHEAVFKREVARLFKAKYLSRDISQSINDALKVNILAKVNNKINKYAVEPSNHFYIYSLMLIDALFREFEDKAKKIMGISSSPDFGLTYMCWNMGEGNFRKFIKSANTHRLKKEYLDNGKSPSIAEWAFNYTPKSNEWAVPRANAIKLRYFNEVYKLVFKGTEISSDNYLTSYADNQLFTPSYLLKEFQIRSGNAILRDENLIPFKARYSTAEIGLNNKGYAILKKGNTFKIKKVKIAPGGNIIAQVALITNETIPLGWTVASNFLGSLYNESIGLKSSPSYASTKPNALTVVDANALIRNPNNGFRSTGSKIPLGSFVTYLGTDHSNTYYRVLLKNSQNSVVWTAKSNLIKNWAPILSSNSAWKRGKFIGLIDLVEVIGTGLSIKQVSKKSLDAYQKLVDFARDSGVQITLNSGFRSYPQQEYLYQNYINNKPGFNPAARPGYSNHQNGIAFDFNTTGKKAIGWGPVYDWLKVNATSFGFMRTVKGEHWHWEFNPPIAKKLKNQGEYRSWMLGNSIEQYTNYLENSELTTLPYIRIARINNFDYSQSYPIAKTYIPNWDERSEENTASIEFWKQFKIRAACIAEREWNQWQKGSVIESEPSRQPFLKKYFEAAHPYDFAMAHSRAASNANPNVDSSAWSGAFISYLMKEAGAGDHFKYSALHFLYILEAKRNKINRRQNPFQLYDLNSAKPEVGDLICNWRGISRLTYNNLEQRFRDSKPPGATRRDYKLLHSHCDIVVGKGIKNGKEVVWVIGGNTGNDLREFGGLSRNTVGKKSRPLDANGFLLPTNNLFGILKIRTDLNTPKPISSGNITTCQLTSTKKNEAPVNTLGVPIYSRIKNTTSQLMNRLNSLMSSGRIGLSVFLAIANGNRNINELTDMVFFYRHPDRNGRRITSNEKAAIREWNDIKKNIITPLLSVNIPINKATTAAKSGISINHTTLGSKIGKYRHLILKYSNIYSVSDKIITGIIAAESGGDPNRKSIGNYKGLMQAGTDDSHYNPEVSIREGTKKFSQFRNTVTREVKKRIGLNISSINNKELAEIVLCGYNAGPVTIIKAIEYAYKDGNWRNWLDTKHYQRALIFSGGFSTKYRGCLKDKSSSDIKEGRKKRLFYAGWRTSKIGWREYHDPPKFEQLKIEAPEVLMCWVNTKHSNTYRYLRKFSKYL